LFLGCLGVAAKKVNPLPFLPPLEWNETLSGGGTKHKTISEKLVDSNSHYKKWRG